MCQPSYVLSQMMTYNPYDESNKIRRGWSRNGMQKVEKCNTLSAGNCRSRRSNEKFYQRQWIATRKILGQRLAAQASPSTCSWR